MPFILMVNTVEEDALGRDQKFFGRIKFEMSTRHSVKEELL